MPNEHLRERGRNQVVRRKVYAEGPPRIKHLFTRYGKCLKPIPRQMPAGEKQRVRSGVAR